MPKFFPTTLALAGALLGASVAAFAQAAPPPAPASAASAMPGGPDGSMSGAGMRHHSKMRAALASLALTSDQQAQIKGFMKAFRDSKQSATPETRKQLLAQIEGVLTPDQQGKFEAQMQAKPPQDGTQNPQ